MSGVFELLRESERVWKILGLLTVWTLAFDLTYLILEDQGVLTERAILKTLQIDIAGFLSIYSMCTFLLSIALGFRVNQAYDRWWEGRTLWGRFITTRGRWRC